MIIGDTEPFVTNERGATFVGSQAITSDNRCRKRASGGASAFFGALLRYLLPSLVPRGVRICEPYLGIIR